MTNPFPNPQKNIPQKKLKNYRKKHQQSSKKKHGCFPRDHKIS